MKDNQSPTMTDNMNYNGILPSIIKPLCDFKVPARDVDDPDCLFQNRWLNKGNCGLLISTSGIGKSAFIMQAAVHWGKGEAMLGICPTRPLKTLIVQAEDDEFDIVCFRNGTRIGLATELKCDSNAIAAAEMNVFVATVSGQNSEALFALIRHAVLTYGFDLVVVNPLHAFFDGNLNESQACSKFLRQGLDPILKAFETRCAALIVHHSGKPKESSGNVLSSYIGNGSAELTNYPRSILAIRPHKNFLGVFDLIGAKHGDRLGWRDSFGRLTFTKTICYANRLPRYEDKGQVIYWVEPTQEELSRLSAHQNHTTGDGSPAHETPQTQLKKANDKGAEANALTLVKHVKSNPSKTINNKSLRKYANTQWVTQVARNAVKTFGEISADHGIGKDSGYYTHSMPRT